MRTWSAWSTLGAVAALAAAAPAVATAHDHRPDRNPAGACSASASLPGFSDALNKTTFAGTGVGGLSALALAGDHRARALVDNQGATPARFYDLDLGRRALAPRATRVTTLRRPGGIAYTGQDFDGEGLVSLPGGSVLASSETEPAIRLFGADGLQRGELPVPARFRVAPAGQATTNLTLEGLGLSPDGRELWAGMEGSLAADGATADGRARLRFLRYRASRQGIGAAGQAGYLADPGLAVSELQVIDRDRLLVLERGFQAGAGNTVRVYAASVAGASDVTRITSLAEPGVKFVRKRLVVDLGACPPSGATTPGTQPNPLLDNVEGMAVGSPKRHGRRSLYLLSDDNFSAGQVTRFYELRVTLP